MSDNTLAKLRVVLEATNAPMKKEMDKTKQAAKDMASSVNKEMSKIKSPLKEMFSKNADMSSIKTFQKKMKESMESIGPKNIFNGFKNRMKQFQLDSGIKVYSDEFLNLENSITNAQKALEELLNKKEKMEKSSKGVYSDEYRGLEQDIKKANSTLDRLIAKQAKMIAIGGVKPRSKSWKSLQYDIQESRETLKEYRELKKNMEDSGDGVYTDEYKKIAEDIKSAEEALDDLLKKKKKLEDSGMDVQRPQSFGSFLSGSVRGLITKGRGGMRAVLGKIEPAIKKTSGAFGALIQKFRSGIPWIGNFNSGMKQSNNTIGGGLIRILKYTVGIRSLFVLFNRTRSYIVDGFKNLAQYSSQTNYSISTLMTSLFQLKNALAAAFAPIVNVVSPVLDMFLRKVISIVNTIGQLTSALTGSGTYIRATRVNQDYAASLDTNASSARDANKANKELQKTILGFDQINKLDNNSDLNDLIGNGGGLGGISPGDMFQTVQIESKYKDFANRIRDLAKKQDWEGLGKEIASAINRGLKYIYDAISWKNVGPKITAFTDAFTRTFNSMVNHIDWDLMGRDIGAGVNTLTNTLNQLIGDGGIDFRNIGSKLSTGLRGAVNEIEWKSLGNLLGNKFMISWNLLNGFISDMSRENDAGLTGWAELGRSIGAAANGIFDRIDFSVISATLTGGINGAFESLSNFTATFNWDNFSENLKGGIKGAITGINWKENGEAFAEFLKNLCNAIKGSITKDTFYELGKGIGEFLGELPWVDLLGTAAGLLIDGFGGALEGLWESGLTGKIVAGLTVAFLAVKVNEITGIGTLVWNIVSHIGNSFREEKNINTLASALKDTLSSGAGEAAEAIETVEKAAGTASSGGILKLITSIMGEAGFYVGTVLLTHKIAELTEELTGGNGVLSETGGAINDLAGKLQNTSVITGAQADEIRKLVDSCEDAGMSSKDMANTIMEKFSEMGLSAETLTAILQSGEYQMGKTAGSVDILTESAKLLGEGFSRTKQQLDLSDIDTEVAYGGIRDALVELRNTNSEVNDYFIALDNILFDLHSTATPAQTALDSISSAMEQVGIPTEELMDLLGSKFPEATRIVKDSVDTNIVGAQEVISTSTGKAEKDANGAFESIGKTAKETSETVNKTVSNNFGDVEDTSVTTWGSSKKSVTDSIRSMKSDTSTGMQQVFKNVESYMTSIYNIITNKFKWAGDMTNILLENMSGDVGKGLYGVNSVVQKQMNSIGYSFSNLKVRIRDSLGGMYGIGRDAAQSFANGISSVHIPMPHISVTSNAYSNGSGYSYNMHSSVNWYEKGGFPDIGEMFVARENGPELVGRMGNKNTVANNSQIVEGIKAGVFEAVMDAFHASGLTDGGESGRTVIVELTLKADSETVYKFVRKGEKKYNDRYCITETV